MTAEILEDNFADIAGKAMRGKKLAAADLAAAAGLRPEMVESLLRGQFDESALRAVAPVLGLQPEALVRIGRDSYHPLVECPPNLVQVTTPCGGMEVNAYLVWDREEKTAAIFDTGAQADPLLDLIKLEELDVAAIFLTHSHADHTAALDDLQKALGVDAWSSQHEPVPGTRTFRPGEIFNAGRNFIRSRHTPGHSPGGVTYVIEGPVLQAAIVGDALFAGSIGGVRGDYAATMDNIRREILGLPDKTILCPGHGPMTTVAQERVNNPFFA